MLASFLNSFSTSQILFWPPRLVTAQWTGLSLQQGFSLAGPSSSSACTHSCSGSKQRFCSSLAPLWLLTSGGDGMAITMQVTAPLLIRRQKRISLTPSLLTSLKIFPFFFRIEFLPYLCFVGGAGGSRGDGEGLGAFSKLSSDSI